MDASLGELFDAYNDKVAELDVINDILNTAWFTIGSKVELFNNAKFVIGPHGAAFSNILHIKNIHKLCPFLIYLEFS